MEALRKENEELLHALLQNGMKAKQKEAQLQETVEKLQQQLEEQHELADQLAKACSSNTAYEQVCSQNLDQRESLLTCPISLELFKDPVTTNCCGKSFSSAALKQALAQNHQCPMCRARNVSAHPSRDVAALVELHRSEKLVLASEPRGLQVPTGTAANAAPRGSQRSRETSGHRDQYREQRSERATARSAVARRGRSRANTAPTSRAVETQSTTQRTRTTSTGSNYSARAAASASARRPNINSDNAESMSEEERREYDEGLPLCLYEPEYEFFWYTYDSD